jgi:predicted RNA-binding Zn-ribbon protein involved in translation (DUF1610 family)
MSQYREEDDWRLSDEARSRDFQIHWKCPQCGYSYDSEPRVNEALNCPDCGNRTVESGESYGERRW